MAKRQLVRVFEYESLYHEGHPKGSMTIDEFNALVKYNQSKDHRFFNVIHQGIKFKQYVGVIQVGNLTIEVLPKADRKSFKDSNEDDRSKWHDVLFEMLKVCHLIKLEESTDADLRLRNASLLDLYINLFLFEVEQILHKGLVKKYHSQVSNLKALSGQLQFQQHISKNLVHRERFFVRHQVYDTNHLLHQILNEALLFIPKVSTNSNFSDRVGRLELSFPILKKVKINSETFQRINYNRKTEHYQSAVELARLLLLNFNPDIRNGKNNVLAILFDMNVLFEEYVYRQFKKAAPFGVKVSKQVGKRFWERKLVKPDIVVSKNGKNTILDTKWKVLKETKPSDADLKQMYVYHHYFEADKTILLYPNVFDLKEMRGSFHYPKNQEFECVLSFVDVLDQDGNLNKNIGEDILNQL